MNPMFSVPLRHQTLAETPKYITVHHQNDCFNVPKWFNNDSVSSIALTQVVYLFAVGGREDCHNPCNVK